MRKPKLIYLRNPCTGDCRAFADAKQAKNFVSYGWEYITALEFRVWHVMSKIGEGHVHA